MGELGRGWCRGRAHRAAEGRRGGEGPQGRPGGAGAGGAGGAPEGGAERRPPCGPRPAACRGWGEAGRSPDGRDARRSGRKSADAARRAAGLRPGVPAAGRGAKGPRRSRGQGIIRRPRR